VKFHINLFQFESDKVNLSLYQFFLKSEKVIFSLFKSESKSEKSEKITFFTFSLFSIILSIVYLSKDTNVIHGLL
jgi:hypothetical protein